MPFSENLVSVILLSYNRPQMIVAAVESVINQNWDALEIIVIDNKSSASDSIEELISPYKRVKLIQNQDNLGFTGGMNLGLELATGKYIYFTEDDIVLEQNCIANLLKACKQDPQVGLCSPVMLNLEAGTIRCAGGDIVFQPEYKVNLYSAEESYPNQDVTNRYVSFIPGASIFGETQFLRELGGFRADFFMYCEDVDLCVRTLNKGKKILIVSDAIVRHFEPKSHPVSALVQYHRGKNYVALHLLYAPWKVVIKYILSSTYYSAFNAKNPSVRDNLKQFIKVWQWILANLPQLLRDRHPFTSVSGGKCLHD
jgi:GT2 family glycosyltransferase